MAKFLIPLNLLLWLMINPFRSAIRRKQEKDFLSVYSLLLSYSGQFKMVDFFQIPVPPYEIIVAIWQHPAGKG